MKIRLNYIIFLGIASLSILLIYFNAEFINVLSLPNEVPISYNDIKNINSDKIFGKNITAEIVEESVNVGGEKFSIKNLIFKLFGFIPIKTIKANIIEDKQVYLGGSPIGLTIDVDGLIVLGSNSINTEEGLKSNFVDSKLKIGDIITKVNGIKVSEIDDIKTIINSENYNGEELTINLLREGKEETIKLKPLKNEEGEYKIGLWVRNDAAGVGTITFVDAETMEFGALGHPITDYETGVFVPAKGGKIFSCSVVGLNKGEVGMPGEIKGVFMQGKNQKGEIDRNTRFGVYGTIFNKDKIIDPNKIADVASRLTIKPGKATLISSISGVSEEYEIEIIKTNYQPTSSEKSFVFRVTDKRLLELTGGIIQGMSGSPIMQNDKVIGAVTHVFVSDPTKGYGIYIDWMIAA